MTSPEPNPTSVGFVPPVPPPWGSGDPPRQADEGRGITSRRLDRPLAALAWLVVAAAVVLTMLAQSARMDEATGGAEGEEGGSLALRVFEIQAKYVLGTTSLAEQSGSGDPDDLQAVVESLDAGPVSQRLRYLVVLADVAGPSAALEAAEQLRAALDERRIEPTPGERSTLEAMEATFALREQEGVTAAPPPETATLLRERLGWFGDLMLAPPGADQAARDAIVGPARLLVIGVVVLVAAVCILGAAGFVGAIVFLVMSAIGRWRTRLSTGVARGPVYAETFCAWFLLFIAFQIVASLAPPEHSLTAGGTAMLASLVALGWPVIRGVRWADVRRDVGLHRGRGVVVEVLAGVAAYAMSLPLMAVGLALMFALMALGGASLSGSAAEFESTDAPAHPLVEVMAGGLGAQIAALLVAAVIAPIVEEIAFRGVLYRHLREGTRRLGAFLSAVASMLLMSFIFAAIHPQGVYAIPVLMALACGFAFAREWRDSLIPGMVAHAVNNGAVVTLLFVAFS